MIRTIKTAALIGCDVFPVNVEVSIIPGKFNITIIGFGRESASAIKKRLISVFHNLQINLGENNYIVNLSPADLKKFGSLFDLPIFVAICNKLNILPPYTLSIVAKSVVCGELSLLGDVKHINGALSVALSRTTLKRKGFILPATNYEECTLIQNINLYPIRHVGELLNGTVGDITPPPSLQKKNPKQILDFNQVYGNDSAKRALQISAAGRHNILLYGPPGSGKSMLSSRLASIMPKLTKEEITEVTKLYSSAGLLERNTIITERPFRNPHHSVTSTGLIGGGTIPYPGEISLAHTGILFLDEFLEFTSRKLEMLREVLEEHTVLVKRASYSIKYPANFILVAAMNPCPCGYFGTADKTCRCTHAQVRSYLAKVSGPLIDRIDMQVGIQPIPFDNINSQGAATSSHDLKVDIDKAIETQMMRNPGKKMNGELMGYEIDKIGSLTKEAKNYMNTVFDNLNISMRSYHKIYKLARTVADLNGSTAVLEEHISEVLMFRSLDKLINRFSL